ncbi:unnamed protein product [Mesocestoides corti]|uniref:acid phosphatase n=1 Tax=Mesocestoides corti TaxID=53468 RepID=A0A0R3UPC8_MESCO|nr:unnamed protein product [Mesocestoides corti]
MVWQQVLWFFSLVLCLVGGEQQSEKLISVFLLARHGERYPCHHLHHPDYPGKFLSNTCQLTVGGAKQHVELGQFIRERYSSLFTSTNFNQKDVHIRSTGTERTLLSAAYFGLGFKLNASNELPLLSAVFSTPKRYDSLLKMSSPCPAFKRLMRQSLNSNLAKDFANGERQLFEDLKEFTDTEFDFNALHHHLPEAWKLCEPIFVWSHLESAGGGSRPPFSSALVAACHRVLSFKQQLRFVSPDQTYLRGGPLWLHLVRTLRFQLAGEEASPPDPEIDGSDILDIPLSKTSRIIAYFAHDSTLAAFLSHLGMFNKILPPFASAIIVELHKLQNDELALRFFYRNDTASSLLTPLTTKFCEGQEAVWCRLSSLEARLKETVAENVEAACSSESPTFPLATLVAVSALAISTIFAFRLPRGVTVCLLVGLLSVLAVYRYSSQL